MLLHYMHVVLSRGLLLCSTYLPRLSALQETSEELGHLLKTLKAQSSGLDPVQAAVVRDAHR